LARATVAPPALPFESAPAPGNGHPTVIVQNAATVSVTVELAGPETRRLTISPGGRGQTRLVPGSYEFTATADGLTQQNGTVAFVPDQVYTWTFFVEVPGPGSSGGS
jgi:hypothetical protein